MQSLVQCPREQVVVALYPLQVRAVPDVLPGPPELQELHPADVVRALAEVEPGLDVVHREGQADVDAADIVDDLHHARITHLDEVVQPDVGLLLDRLPQAGRPAVGEGVRDLLQHARLGPLPGKPVPGRAGVGGHDRVPGDVHHGDLVTAGGDVHQHYRLGDGVPEVAADVPAELLPAGQPGGAARGEHQQVQRVVVLGRAFAQVGDGNPVDAGPHTAEFPVGTQQGQREDADE